MNILKQRKQRKQYKFFFILITVALCLSTPAHAKKKKEAPVPPPQNQSTTTTNNPVSSTKAVQARINALSEDNKRQYDSLSKEQKDTILKGKVDIGFNEWMIKLAIGDPYYGTEHHPIYVDYEQVWLYTKPEIKNEIKEEQITDSQTHWPTIHRTVKKESCMIGDYFLLFDRGVVEKIVPEEGRKVYGSCTVETSEAYLPIVNGKPVEPK